MIAYITGTSSGIGKALAEKLLEEGHQVFGISRSSNINHSNYKHIYLDLSQTKAVSEFHFESNSDEDVILVNNAGTIGPIKPIGHQTSNDIIDLNAINIIAPQLLTNKFIHQFSLLNQNYQIINISSGAGQHPIDAWATYCASKSAIDLFSETVAQELKERYFLNWHIFSIAPGVVDTKMQENIRASNDSEFLVKQKFIDLKNNNDLATSNQVANHLYRIIKSPNKYPKTTFSIKELM